MARETCVHCGNTAVVGTKSTQVEWNPVNEHWQCRNVVKCAQRAAEAKLAARLRRELGGG
jgi:hypothetical protein